MEAMATAAMAGVMVDAAGMLEVMEVTAIMGRDRQKLKQGMATVAMVDIAQEVMEVMVAMEGMAVMVGMVAMEGMATMERGLPPLSQQP